MTLDLENLSGISAPKPDIWEMQPGSSTWGEWLPTICVFVFTVLGLVALWVFR